MSIHLGEPVASTPAAAPPKRESLFLFRLLPE